MISLIDGDSIAFMLGWHHKEHRNIDEMHKAVDLFLENIFIMTGADMYYGAIGTDDKCFRYGTYKVKPYKGNRVDLVDHMEFWRPVIKQYLIDKWMFDEAYHSSYPEFISPSMILEADDLVYTTFKSLLATSDQECIICSPDKDLKQISGFHYNYQKGDTCHVDIFQADYNFFKLMLEGDDSDNISGIPGFGPKKAQEKLLPLLNAKADRTSYEELVYSLYHRHFGHYYGDIIYRETEQTISLVWDQQRKIHVHAVPTKPHPFETLSGAD